ncbi:MAG: hypothetical protein HUJ30_00695 [Gammaproteobacteria bacterium]|nr:hypothetical protein [Gammaproteobacteria bacterium]
MANYDRYPFAGVAPMPVSMLGHYDPEPQVILNKLPQDKKREVWEHLKKHHSHVAKMIEEDPFLKEIRDTFGVDIALPHKMLKDVVK